MRPSSVEGHVNRLCGVLLFLVAVFPGAGAGTAQETTVNADAKLLAEFKERVDAYVDLRKKVDDPAPKLDETEEPAKIREAQLALAERVKAARSGAKQGDVFTPAAVTHFRRLLRPPVKETGTKQQLNEENPGPVPFKVNERYPEKQPRSTVPPNVLESLPALPKEQDLEYRFIGRHLILLDTRANLIVDYMPNALP
jgi:hypothetical protein